MRVQRFSPALLIGAALTLAGCGGSPVTIEVAADGPAGPVPQANTEVRLFPFDRDSVFDVLDSQASTPKPEVSADMVATFEEIGVLQKHIGVAATELENGFLELLACLCRYCPTRRGAAGQSDRPNFRALDNPGDLAASDKQSAEKVVWKPGLTKDPLDR